MKRLSLLSWLLVSTGGCGGLLGLQDPYDRDGSGTFLDDASDPSASVVVDGGGLDSMTPVLDGTLSNPRQPSFDDSASDTLALARDGNGSDTERAAREGGEPDVTPVGDGSGSDVSIPAPDSGGPETGSADSGVDGAGDGPPPPPPSCPRGDGLYCGGDGITGDSNTVFRCTGGNLSVAQACTNGCQVVSASPPNDQCAPPPPPPPCPNGDGLFCGGNGVTGASNTLYCCLGGSQAVAAVCGSGCEANHPGVDDQCDMSSCPNNQNGPYCGGNGVPGCSISLYNCTGGHVTLNQRCPNACVRQPQGLNDYCR
jgi:hypothetical protein